MGEVSYKSLQAAVQNKIQAYVDQFRSTESF